MEMPSPAGAQRRTLPERVDGARLFGVEHRRVGKSGLWVSAVAYGTGAPTSPRPEEEVLGCVAAALDAGITTLDTADSYGRGRSERLLGRAFTGLRRESLVILTKVCFPTGPGPNDHGLSRKHIRSAIDGSLCRLNTDYVDVYQAHRFDHRVPLEETMVAFADLVRAGKVRYLGVSEWTADQIRAAKAL